MSEAEERYGGLGEKVLCHDERIDCGSGRAANVTQGSLGGGRMQHVVVKCNGLEARLGGGGRGNGGGGRYHTYRERCDRGGERGGGATEVERDRQTDRQTGRDRVTEREGRDRQTDRHRQTDRQRHREREGGIERGGGAEGGGGGRKRERSRTT